MNCWRHSSAISSRSTPRTRRCRAGTSTPACARCSTCSILSMNCYRNRLCDRARSDFRRRGAAGNPSRRERNRARTRAPAPHIRRSARAAMGAGRRAGTASSANPDRLRRGRDDGLLAALMEQLPFELTTGQREVLETLSTELAATRPMNRMLQGEVGLGKDHRLGAGHAADGRRGLSVRAARADGSPCRPTCPLGARCPRSVGDGRPARRCRERDTGGTADRIDVSRSRRSRCATRSPPARRASSSAHMRCSRTRLISRTSAWWSSTSSIGSVSNSEIGCAPRRPKA